jgi:hypothetical protein
VPVGPDVPLDASGSVDIAPAAGGDLVVLNTPDGSPDGVQIEISFADGETTIVSFSRKGHFPADWRLERAATSLSDLQSKGIERLAVIFNPELVGHGASVQLMSANPSHSSTASSGG